MISSTNWRAKILQWLKIDLKKEGSPNNRISKPLLRRWSMKKDKSWNKKLIVFWEEKADQEKEGTREGQFRGKKNRDILKEKEGPEDSLRDSRSIILLETMGYKLSKFGMLRTMMEISTLLPRSWELKKHSRLENSLSKRYNLKEGMRQVQLFS